jgi:hypothetical protein
MEVVVAVATLKVGTVLDMSHWIKDLKRLFAEWTLFWNALVWFGLVQIRFYRTRREIVSEKRFHLKRSETGGPPDNRCLQMWIDWLSCKCPADEAIEFDWIVDCLD